MLPIELWTHICSLSTFDDGYTIRSLGQVSSFFRAAAAPFRLRTLSVHNWRQIINLTIHLESLPDEKRNVEFLHAICAPLEGLTDTSVIAGFYRPGICDRHPGPSPVCFDPSLPHRATPNNAVQEEIVESVDELLAHVVARLLTAVRTTVRIAHVHLQDYRDFVFFPIVFERLEELTLRGSFESFYKAYLPFLPENTTIRRLSVDNVELHASSTFIDSIVAYAPQLTHLYWRLSNYSSQELVVQLDKLLVPSSRSDETEGPPTKFPATLQKLYIHPGLRAPPARCGTGIIVRMMAKRTLFDLCHKPQNEDRVVLLKEEQYRDEPLRVVLSQREGEDEWLDRIGGGLGCWDDLNRMVSLY